MSSYNKWPMQLVHVKKFNDRLVSKEPVHFDEGLTLQTSASLSLHGGNLTHNYQLV